MSTEQNKDRFSAVNCGYSGTWLTSTRGDQPKSFVSRGLLLSMPTMYRQGALH